MTWHPFSLFPSHIPFVIRDASEASLGEARLGWSGVLGHHSITRDSLLIVFWWLGWLDFALCVMFGFTYETSGYFQETFLHFASRHVDLNCGSIFDSFSRHICKWSRWRDVNCMFSIWCSRFGVWNVCFVFVCFVVTFVTFVSCVGGVVGLSYKTNP